MSVSILCAGRNYGRYLDEALRSAVGQTVPARVIYRDDNSTDGSDRIAARIKGVEVYAAPERHGATFTRNVLSGIATTDWVLYLDADDILPPNYVERMLAAAAPGVACVYSDLRAFGLQNYYWRVPDWGTQSIWRRNFVHTSALIRRDALHAVGGWIEAGYCPDWHLAIRLSRWGRMVRGNTALRYRKHGGGWTDGTQAAERTKAAEFVRRDLLRLAVGTIYGGRLPGVSRRIMERTEKAAAEFGAPCYLLDASGSGLSPRGPGLVTAWADRPDPSLPRGKAVCEFMARATTELMRQARAGGADALLLIEDDVEPPPGFLRVLFDALTAGDDPPAAVAGCYQNRHTRRGYVSGYYSAGQVQELHAEPQTATSVDLTGTGCLLFRLDAVPESCPSHLGAYEAHDWALSWAMRQRGERVELLPLRCRHWVDDGQYI